MSLRIYTPCNDGECPYNSETSSTCEYHCGQEEPEDYPDEFEEYPDIDEYADMMPCDYSGLCSGPTCSNWLGCQGSTHIRR